MSSARRVLVTGATGQDGSYLCDQLEAEGAVVKRVERAVFVCNAPPSLLRTIITAFQPTEIYHLAAQLPAPGYSDEMTLHAAAVNTAYVLDAAWSVRSRARILVAGSAEMFDAKKTGKKNEDSPILPRGAYGIGKAAAYFLAREYREVRGLDVRCAIMFNHDSPRRSYRFMSRKVSSGVARIKLGLQDKLVLGDLRKWRDRGHALDYVAGMRAIMAHSEPDDFVLATGRVSTTRDFVERAFRAAGISDWQAHVVPAGGPLNTLTGRAYDPEVLCGDPSKAKHVLGWEAKITVEELARMMVDNDLIIEAAQAQRTTTP